MPNTKRKLEKKDLLGKAKTSGYQPVDMRWYRRPRDLPLMTWRTIEQMKMEPTIRLGLAMRAAPLMNAEFAYKDLGAKDWTPGIRASSAIVAEFVLRQIKRIWASLDVLLIAQEWGWAACEVTYHLTDYGTVEIDRLLPRHPRDVRALVRDGDVCGARFMRLAHTQHGQVDLDFPRAIYHTHNPQPGGYYGVTILEGAYSPYYDKWGNGGALDSRRLTFQQNAIQGRTGFYPDGSTQLPIGDGGGAVDVPNRDIMRMALEQMLSGNVACFPSDTDAAGNRRWELREAKAMAGLEYVLQYPKDLDVEMLRGMEIPDDFLTAESTGSWQGKQVPMMAFYGGLDRWLKSLVRDIKLQILDPLVAMNWGRQWYEIETKPLAEHVMEQAKAREPEQGPPATAFAEGAGANDGDDSGYDRPQRMSLEAAVGRGTVQALEIVRAARSAIDGQFMRMRTDAPAGARWVTISGRKGADGNRKGGFPVLLDEYGNILRSGGPKGLVGKHVSDSGDHFDDLASGKRRENYARQQAAEAEGPLGKSRSWGRIVAAQADKWGLDSGTYEGIAKEVWEEELSLHEDREAAKKYARDRLKLSAGDINRLENQGFDAGSKHARIKGLDTLGREMASLYPSLGWGGGFGDDDGADHSESVWELVKEGRQDAPSRISRDFHERIDDFLQGELDRHRRTKREPAKQDDTDWSLVEFSTEIADAKRLSTDAQDNEHKGEGPEGGRYTEKWTGDANASKPAISVSGDEFGKGLSPKALRAAAFEHAMANFRGKVFVNRSTGKEIRVSRRGIQKTLTHLPDVGPIKLMAKLPELLESAEPVGSAEPIGEAENIKAYHYFSATAELEGAPVESQLVIAEDNNGNWYYDQHVTKK
ncbi:MAG: hypothetical protein WD872_17625 [Pirellulaceae bacterium]